MNISRVNFLYNLSRTGRYTYNLEIRQHCNPEEVRRRMEGLGYEVISQTTLTGDLERG